MFSLEVPSIGGRYSALSNFGMVPAAAMGLDTKKFLARAAEMVQCLRSERGGRTKTQARCWASFSGRPRTPVATKLRSLLRLGFRIWARGSNNCLPNRPEKRVKASFRSIAKHLAAPEVYGSDRVFVYVRLESGVRRGSGSEARGHREGGASGCAHHDGRHL